MPVIHIRLSRTRSGTVMQAITYLDSTKIPPLRLEGRFYVSLFYSNFCTGVDQVWIRDAVPTAKLTYCRTIS